MTETESRRPIFILGMLQRSGTNFLRDLLIQHPRCGGTEVLAEDFLVHHAELLQEYCDWVHGHWADDLHPVEVREARRRLMRRLGEAILDFIRESVPGERPVVKTPSVRNIHLFDELFEEADLLVIVRDGRDLVESGMRSFGWKFDGAVRKWARAVRTIHEFERQAEESGRRWRLVHYEDLNSDLEGEMTAILETFELNPKEFDFEAAGQLPVKGSSTHRGGREEVHWDAVPKTEKFRPVRRWADWSRARHERFNWLAGPELSSLGYRPVEYSGADVRWRAWNRWQDGKGRFQEFLRKVRRRLESRFVRRAAGGKG